MVHHFEEIYYKKCLLSKAQEKTIIINMLNNFYEHCAQADFSEVLDLTNYKIIKSSIKARAILRAYLEKPFLFAHCLN